MSPVIRISDPVFKRLQGHATPLVDTPATVIEKILDYYDFNEGRSIKDKEKTTLNIIDPIKLKPDNPEDLTHTKIISAEFDGIKVSNWYNLVIKAHIAAKNKYGDFNTLKMNTIANISNAPRKDKGFKYIDEAIISIQGETAIRCWEIALFLAKKLNVSIKVKFMWRSNKKSAYPGRIGQISWNA